jgi:hypothetical protein
MPKFMPKVGAYLTVSLPGELLRSLVQKVIGQDSVIVEISSEPMATKSHPYKFGQIIACRREYTPFGEEWVVAPTRERTLQEIEQEEKEHAAAKRKLELSEIKKHKRVDEHGEVSTKTSSGNITQQRSETPERKSGGSAKPAIGTSGLGRTVAK